MNQPVYPSDDAWSNLAWDAGYDYAQATACPECGAEPYTPCDQPTVLVGRVPFYLGMHDARLNAADPWYKRDLKAMKCTLPADRPLTILDIDEDEFR